MKDDFILEQKFGRELPFKVPEDYFSQFETQLLKNLPERTQRNGNRNGFISRHLRLIGSVAACLAVLIVSSIIYFNRNIHNDVGSHGNTISDYVSSSAYADYVIDEYSDYALFDNDDFYSYVMDE